MGQPVGSILRLRRSGYYRAAWSLASLHLYAKVEVADIPLENKVKSSPHIVCFHLQATHLEDITLNTGKNHNSF